MGLVNILLLQPDRSPGIWVYTDEKYVVGCLVARRGRNPLYVEVTMCARTSHSNICLAGVFRSPIG